MYTLASNNRKANITSPSRRVTAPDALKRVNPLKILKSFKRDKPNPHPIQRLQLAESLYPNFHTIISDSALRNDTVVDFSTPAIMASIRQQSTDLNNRDVQIERSIQTQYDARIENKVKRRLSSTKETAKGTLTNLVDACSSRIKGIMASTTGRFFSPFLPWTNPSSQTARNDHTIPQHLTPSPFRMDLDDPDPSLTPASTDAAVRGRHSPFSLLTLNPIATSPLGLCAHCLEPTDDLSDACSCPGVRAERSVPEEGSGSEEEEGARTLAYPFRVLARLDMLCEKTESEEMSMRAEMGSEAWWVEDEDGRGVGTRSASRSGSGTEVGSSTAVASDDIGWSRSRSDMSSFGSSVGLTTRGSADTMRDEEVGVGLERMGAGWGRYVTD
ncbi:hypothetical protein MMC21_005593 [Puttea exsequens]|nr:hypothetical protein [Puttea exsequens]